MANITGAIAFIESNLYIACVGHILTMNLQGESRGSVSLPDVQFLHPVGQTKMYCISLNNISYLDIPQMEQHQLSEFPFHPDCLTSDDCGNIYFIIKGAVCNRCFRTKKRSVLFCLKVNRISVCFTKEFLES